MTDTILIKHCRRTISVPVSEVLYLKAELKYVTLRTPTNTYIHDQSLAELAPLLKDRFVRIHRNALVAVGAFGWLSQRDGEGWTVQIFATAEFLQVSRRQLPVVRAALASEITQ